MNKLWHFNDYVNHLSHKNLWVRRWAFKALENRFPNRYIDKVSCLIGDDDDNLVCSAVQYLAHWQAVQHAPAILEKFIMSQGNVPCNCAYALGKMHYEQAAGVMLKNFVNPLNSETFSGVLFYFGRIESEVNREALQSSVAQLRDEYLLGFAMSSLLIHSVPEDVYLVIDRYFASKCDVNTSGILLNSIIQPLGGGSYFKYFTEPGSNKNLSKPVEMMDNITLENPHIEIDETFKGHLIEFLEKGRFNDFLTAMSDEVRSIINFRYPDADPPDCLNELYKKDIMCLFLIEALQKRHSANKLIKKSYGLNPDLIALIISAYFAVQERKSYVNALYPHAGVDEAIQALKNSGSELPKQIREKIRKLSPVKELKEALSNDLDTWGDIWIVRSMEEIGDKDFVPDLIRILGNVDNLDYIHSDAITAANALEESADESLIAAIQNNEIGAWESFGILEFLPYAEAYDLALDLWESDGDDIMDSYEIFSDCLKGIGDKRGIGKLQDIYENEYDGDSVGRALECLSQIYQVEIPQLPHILQKRKELEETQQARLTELIKLSKQVQAKKKQEMTDSWKGSTYKKDAPKVGRNEPCPCGSGKK